MKVVEHSCLLELIIKIWWFRKKNLGKTGEFGLIFFQWNILCIGQNHIFQIEIWCNFTKKGGEKKHYLYHVPKISTSNNVQITADNKAQVCKKNQRNFYKKKPAALYNSQSSQPERFELSRGNPMYLAGTRLNHSAKAAIGVQSWYLYIFIGFFS